MKKDDTDVHDMFNSGSGISDATSSFFPLIRQLQEFLHDWRFLFVGLRWWFAKLQGRA